MIASVITGYPWKRKLRSATSVTDQSENSDITISPHNDITVPKQCYSIGGRRATRSRESVDSPLFVIYYETSTPTFCYTPWPLYDIVLFKSLQRYPRSLVSYDSGPTSITVVQFKVLECC